MKTSVFYRVLTALLAMVMVIGLMAPVGAVVEPSVSDYSSFLANLKVLEQYAAAYANTNSGKNAGKLVLNFIRTGVPKYTTGAWQTMAGEEDTGFVDYVKVQDVQNGTTATGLRNLSTFTIPNGQTVEFEHMFGAMEMAYHNANNTDLGSWAGDLSDLLYYSKKGGAGNNTSVEAMIADVRENYLGVDEDGVSGFGMLDIYGDLDSYYLVRAMKEGKLLSTTMEGYFTASLTDSDRATFFLNHRFKGVLTREDVRKAVYDSYCGNLGTQMLDAENGITEDDNDLKMACCYAFSDYLFELAEGRLDGPSGDEGGEGGEGDDEGGNEVLPDNKYYSVFSSTDSTLAPGITQSIKYAYTADNKQMAYYVSTVDINRNDVSIHANYNANDPSKGWAMSRVMDQMLAAQKRHTDPTKPDLFVNNYNVVVGVNADFFNMSTGKPSGALVMEGVTYHGVGSENFFAILDDGSAVIGAPSEWSQYADRVQEAVGGSSFIVKNGENVAGKSATYYNSRASRTSVGLTAEGKVVLMVLDGRQEPFSCGGALEEIAQIMIDAGCVTAINLDGGGSSTFVSKAEGADELSVVNRPSDGYQRSVSSSLVVVSTAVVSNEFSYAAVSSDYDYLTNYTSIPMSAVGVSISGHSAQIPEGAYWTVSDESIGMMDGNVFTACGLGDVEVYLMVNGAIVGSKTLHVVEPDEVHFVNASTNVIYGVPAEIPFVATYMGNPVAFNDMEYFLICDPENAGWFEGTMFTADEGSGLRSADVAVLFLLSEGEIFNIAKVSMYSADEAIFDFDDITGGDRKLAWDREISNSTTEDGVHFQAIDPDGTMDITYTFGLDMEAIEIPPQLADLTYMLPGSDIEGASAWSFLLQLAQRVSDMTYVKVTAQFDENLDVDISEMTMSNEYFKLTSAELDEETNTLTIVANWIRQSQAIKPNTANPICILSGIKATPKDGADWQNNKLSIINKGEVTYDIFLRASQLYSFSSKPENQKQFNLYPFENPNYMYNGAPEKGGHFASTYAVFADSFELNKTNRQGWYSNGNNLFYFVDNVAVSGIQALPGYEDPANTYYYSFEDDGTCNGTITGLFEKDGETMYAIGGKLRTGWQTVTVGSELEYYYFDPATGYAADGVQTIDGYTYTFTNHILTRGHLEKNSVGTRYMWAGQWVSQAWLNIDGNISYAEQDTYFRTGLEYKRNPDTYELHLFVFDENGVWQKDHNGLYDVDGKTYLVEGGYVVEYPGLVKMGEDYYYFNSAHYMVKGRTYWISKTNGYLPAQNYTFDADGKLLLDAPVPPTTQPKPTEPTEPSQPDVLNGIVKVDANTWYYYENGVKTYAGVVEIGGDYYYVNSSCKVIHGCSYWISKTNGLVDEMKYTFDADGKMILPSEPGVTQPPATQPSEPGTTQPGTTQPLLNGIVKETEDVWYYYVNGVKTYAGLIVIDGDYYYVSSSFKVIHGCTYWISKTNGRLPEARYTFDADGKMVLAKPEPPTTQAPTTQPTEPTEPPTTLPPLNGIVKETEDVWYYYVDGVKTYAGVFEIDGDYYYAKSSGEVVHGCTYWISKTNGLLKEQRYTFDADGKIVLAKPEPPTTQAPTTQPTEPPTTLPPLNGIVKETEDVWYYYVDGVKTYAGVFELGGDYYYAKSNGEVVHGRTYWITKTNGLLKEQNYVFDAEGKIVLP